MRLRLLAGTVGALAVAGLAAVSAYAIAVRPRITRWGASEVEVRETLPGDEVVPEPKYETTRAITIDAPASAVWPWLVQMGQGRGGLYTYDWLENIVGLEMRSADRIVPEWQHLEVGDKIRLAPESYTVDMYFLVDAIDPERALVLRTPGDPQTNFAAGLPYGSWAFVLRPIDEHTTRLIVRWRADYNPTLAGKLVNHYGLEPAHFAMERGMLLGIKERAEGIAK